MANPTPNSKSGDLEWFSNFDVAPTTHSLQGDKIILPSSALEQLLEQAPRSKPSSISAAGYSDFEAYEPYTFAAQRHSLSRFDSREQQLPNPLTFRIVNPENGKCVYAGIREFSAEEGQVVLSPFLLRALEIQSGAVPDVKNGENAANGTNTDLHGSRNSPKVAVHFEKLPKGKFVKLRPLEPGYDPEDWKALLESHLRSNFTTLSRGEILEVHTSTSESFRFVLDEFQPESNGICVVDTDLEVDIEALNEEQARETLKRIAERRRLAPGTEQGSSRGGQLKLMKGETGQVLEGEYVDYELSSWPRHEALDITLDTDDDSEHRQLDILLSPFSTRQRARPRQDEHVFANFEDRPSKRLRLSSSNVELDGAESLYIAVHAPPRHVSEENRAPTRFALQARLANIKDTSSIKDVSESEQDVTICSNCRHAIPKQSIILHEGFCRRNNVRCPYSATCDRVFQRNSRDLQEHWHCDKESCGLSGFNGQTREYHDQVFHTPVMCPSCSYPDPFPSVPVLAQHRTTLCPGKHILCQFCHLVVPQEGSGADPFATPDAEVVMSGLTAHEVADGGRTTECHMCNRIVRLRDMETHLKNHDFERFARPFPRVCRNVLCGRTLDGANASGDTRSASKVGQGPGNDVGLCSFCFAPLYVSAYDPEGKALKRRVERRYLSQLTAGCGKQWCRNPLCKTGSLKNNTDQSNGTVEPSRTLTVAEAIPIAKPYVDGVTKTEEIPTPLHFCTDEASQQRRTTASMLAAEGKGRPDLKQYSFPWCVAALEAQKGNLSKAQEWLKNFAPSIDEEAQRQT